MTKDGNDQNFKQMISEACAQAAADKVDFSKYDNNGDRFVDLVYIIYAGYSQSISGNSDDYLWPKSGTDNFYKYNVAGNKDHATGVSDLQWLQNLPLWSQQRVERFARFKNPFHQWHRTLLSRVLSYHGFA